MNSSSLWPPLLCVTIAAMRGEIAVLVFLVLGVLSFVIPSDCTSDLGAPRASALRTERIRAETLLTNSQVSQLALRASRQVAETISHLVMTDEMRKTGPPNVPERSQPILAATHGKNGCPAGAIQWKHHLIDDAE